MTRSTMLPHTLSTVGYQGHSIATFVDLLASAGIDTLIDVRRRAMSRKRGFAKTALRGALEERGITYVHYRDLGMPEELMRHRNLTDNSGILAAYRAQLESHDDEIGAVADKVTRSNVCLMCFEEEPHLCHRTILAERIAAQTGARIRELQRMAS